LSNAGPPRCCLSVPGSSQRKIEKAFGLTVGEVALDLEDAVAPALKDEARGTVVRALRTRPEQAHRVAVRVNPPRSPWCHLDLIALAESSVPPASIILPKVERGEDVGFAERLIAGVRARSGAAPPIRIQALIESAVGLEHAAEIARASPALCAIILGYADLSASLRRRPSGPDTQGPNWDPARHAILTAARAANIRAVDGPYLGIDVTDDFLAAVRHSRELGFDGKWAIHPSHVTPIQEIFAPTQEEITRARETLRALAISERDQGAGAVALNGQMVDEAVRRWALDTVAEAADR
jgi:citrate lyase subunit beta / citryl-CoA lyase